MSLVFAARYRRRPARVRFPIMACCKSLPSYSDSGHSGGDQCGPRAFVLAVQLSLTALLRCITAMDGAVAVIQSIAAAGRSFDLRRHPRRLRSARRRARLRPRQRCAVATRFRLATSPGVSHGESTPESAQRILRLTACASIGQPCANERRRRIISAVG